MAAKIKFSPIVKNNILDGLASSFANGIIRGFGGVEVADTVTDPGVAIAVEFTKDGGVFVPGAPGNGINFIAAAAGVLAKDAETYEGVGLVATTLTWFRHYNNDLTKWIQGTVNTTGAAMTTSTNIVTIGGPIGIITLQYRF